MNIQDVLTALQSFQQMAQPASLGSGSDALGILAQSKMQDLMNPVSPQATPPPAPPSKGAAPVPKSGGGLSGLIRSINPRLSEGEASRYADAVASSAQAYGVDPKLMIALFQQESGFNAKAVSPAGARGIGQLMPGTAAGLGVRDSFDPIENIQAATKLIGGYLKRYPVPLALAAYNAGEGAVKKYKGIPPYKETQGYVRNITSRYSQLSGR